jgi:hypothetical protein
MTCGLYLRRVWYSSNYEKTTPKLHIQATPPWGSFTVDLRSEKVFGTTPDFPHAYNI